MLAQSTETKAVVGAAEDRKAEVQALFVRKQPPTLAKSREKKSTICAAETREAEVYAPLVSEQPPALAKSREKKSAIVFEKKEEEGAMAKVATTRRTYPALQPTPALLMDILKKDGLWVLEFGQFGKLLHGAAFLDGSLLKELASIAMSFRLVKLMISLIRGCV